MSPLLREKLLIALAPDAVEYTFLSARSRNATSAERGVSQVGVQGAEPWRGAVTTLAGVLSGMAARKPACSVVLSSHFVRCQLLSWNDNIHGLREYAALARAQFGAVHGAAAEDWDIRLARAQFGAPLLACAVDKALLVELDRLAADAGGRISSVQPYFSAAFDRWRSACKGPAWWFVVIEPGRLWLGRAAGGAWESVSSRVLGRNPVGEMLTALDQEITISPAATNVREPIHVVATGLGREDILVLRESGLSVLELPAGRRFDLGGSALAAA